MHVRQKALLVSLAFAIAPVAESAMASPATVTVLYGNHAVEITQTLEDPTDLWVTAADLKRINGFELKAEGACLNDICIPLNQEEDNALVVTRRGKKWVNLTAFAQKLDQSWVVERAQAVWSFSAVPIARTAYIQSAVAPDFELPDRSGKMVRLSDFRGKKVMILTWASW